MALPILDGNQTSTTLATTVSGGAHYPNHIIASSVTISSLPAISGTVTANVPNLVQEDVDSIGFYGVPAMGKNSDNDTYKILKIDQDGILAISGTVTANVPFTTIGDGIFTYVSDYGNFPISGTVTANVTTKSWYSSAAGGLVDTQFIAVGGFDSANNQIAPIPLTDGAEHVIVSGIVSVVNSVAVGSLPVQLSTTTIGGTARLNVTLSSATTIGATAPSYGNLYGGSDGTNLRAILVDSSGRTTVTGSVSLLGTPTVTFSAIAGTVTANNPNGTLTTRFGSVTTANTVLATTCVTNTNRKYLLVQNNQTGTSAGTVTIGIGFTPTTTQGIQLISGASYTADSFVPTGAVYWLGSVTGATFTILEG